MFRFGIFGAMILCLAMSAAAINVSISGTVKTAQGKAIDSAKITTSFFRASTWGLDTIITFTDTAGRFTLAEQNVSLTSTLPHKTLLMQTALPFKFKDNVVIFSPALGSVNGKIDILSADGKTLFSDAFSDLKAGKQGIMLPRLVSGVNIMRITLGGNLYMQELVSLGNTVYSKAGFGYIQKSVSTTMAKRVAFIDTLISSKKNNIDTRVPLDTYTKTNVTVSMSPGVLKTTFPIGNSIIPNWKMTYSTVDSSVTLWSASDLNEDIDGGFERYTNNGMLQAADITMIGPRTGEIDSFSNPGHLDTLHYELQNTSFIMDFGTETNAKAMYQGEKAKYSSELKTIKGYDTSKAFGYEGIGSLTVSSYDKQFYFELILIHYAELDTASAHAKIFLDYFRSKVP
jgi:hypothetical protein